MKNLTLMGFVNDEVIECIFLYFSGFVIFVVN